MSASALIDRLEKPRRSGNGRWLARCPAHADKSPSLSVRELEDGRVLVHCFGGCSVESVLAAAGLDFSALFPPNPIEHAGPRRRDSYPAADVLRALCDEMGVVAVIASDLEHGREVKPADFERLRLARERIETARRLALGD